jgi:hypothetical protein
LDEILANGIPEAYALVDELDEIGIGRAHYMLIIGQHVTHDVSYNIIAFMFWMDNGHHGQQLTKLPDVALLPVESVV